MAIHTSASEYSGHPKPRQYAPAIHPSGLFAAVAVFLALMLVILLALR